ncbi:MAG: hypothetical protein K0U41_04045 [Gammaproteobacteria bacterium]|nr:hypothetical protein [Gammaproteobacteria bacterium]
MANTLPNVDIPAGVWTDLYSETGISVGTRITAENINDENTVRLFVGQNAPSGSGEDSGYGLLPPLTEKQNASGDPGAWAWSPIPTTINVRES